MVSQMVFDGVASFDAEAFTMLYYGDQTQYNTPNYEFSSALDFQNNPVPMLTSSGVGAGADMTGVSVTTVSAVPVPAAVWLFGSGLIGLAGVARRKA
jgi:hypothetical protein